MPPSNTSFRGASASTAGDDFHELWALTKTLGLLDPHSSLLRVTVEGVPSDEIHAQIGDHGQAADVTEVRRVGGVETTTYEQLKYSTANADSAWTWGRLFARRSATRPETSVIGKLAGLYAAVTGPRSVRIVTNQPLSPSVADDFRHFPNLLRAGRHSPSDDLKRLRLETGLDDVVLADFLDAFDLSAFGEASRLQLATGLLKTLGQMTDADARFDLETLQSRIAALVLPDNRARADVDRETLLAWLGAGSPALLYPSRSELSRPDVWVERQSTATLVADLVAPTDLILRLSAGGGCGKTAFVTMLADYLPAGSEAIVFDCYGGGLFKSSDGRRHLPQQAFVQVANELAGRLGTPLVLRPSSGPELTAAFIRRIDAAARVLADRRPDALLVLVFDAADNARIAAEHWQERCFLDELAAVGRWPENVRVIVTCRPGRKDTLGSTDRFRDLTLEAFGEIETRQFVSLVQPSWSDAVADELHDLTGGVPRRLAYAVEDIGAERPQDAVERLMPRSPGMDPLFLHRVREAGARIGDPAAVDRMLCALAYLPRPMPSWALAAAAGLDEGDLPGLADDLGGLVQSAAGWSFQDEDFEAFVGTHTAALAQAVLGRACDFLASRQADAPYAAASLGEAYLAANRRADLFALAQSDPARAAVLEEGDRRDLQMRRLILSLRAARHAADPLQAQALLLTASKAVRTRRLITHSIVGALDLSADLSPDEAFRQIAAQSGKQGARGELRLRLAIAAASKDLAEARNHLRWWRAWAAEALEAKTRKTGEVTTKHIALEFEANCRVFGLDHALNALTRWTPRDLLLEVADRAICLALEEDRHDDIEMALGWRRWPRAVPTRLVARLLERGERGLDPGFVRDAVVGLIRQRIKPNAWVGRGVVRSEAERVLLILEFALGDVALRSLVLRALDARWTAALCAAERPGTWVSVSGDLIARAMAVRDALTGETTEAATMLPAARPVVELPNLPRGQKPDAERQKQEDENEAADRFNKARENDLETLAGLLTTARTRLADPGTPALDGLLTASARTRRLGRPETGLDAVLAQLHACDIARDAARSLEPVRSWIATAPTAALQLDRLEQVVGRTGGAERFAEDLVGIQAALQAVVAPASSKVETLLRCARLARTYDPDLRRIFYGQALSVAADVDLEAVEHLVAAAEACADPLAGPTPALKAVAEGLVGLTETVHDMLGEEVSEYMPLAEVVTGAAVQSAETGLAVVGRWRDDGYLDLVQGLEALNDERVLAGMSASKARALRELMESSALPDNPDAADVEGFARRVATSSGASSIVGGAERLQSLAPSLRAGPWARGLIEAAGVWPAVTPKPVKPAQATTRIGTLPQLQTAVDALTAQDHPSAWDMCEIANGLQSNGLRVPLLRMLIIAHGGSSAFAHFLQDILPDWIAYPSVANWARSNMTEVIVRALKHTLGMSYRDADLLEALLQYLEGPRQRIDAVLMAVEAHGDNLAPEIMISLAGVIARVAAPDQRLPLVSALLDHTAASLGKAQISGVPSAPVDLDVAFSRFLFGLMADVDKRVRWQAAHAARELLKDGDPGFAKACIDLLKSVDEPVFARPNAFFYLQAARLQLAVLLHRVSLEAPATLTPHAAAIAAAATSEPAHVLIRGFLKNTVLALERGTPGSVTATDLAHVAALNSHKVVKRAPAVSLHGRRRGDGRDDARYEFDDTDTLPYWFSPAAALFDLDLTTFQTMAERWICDVWRAPLDSWKWADEPRPNRFRNTDGLTSHRHGAEPTVERMARYLDWHAMFCVVGELLGTHPVVHTSYSETFEDWLAGYGLTEPEVWVSDLLGPAPAERRFWRRDDDWRLEGAEWLRSWNEAGFTRETTAGDRIVVAGRYSRTSELRSEHIKIDSALVSPVTALSLASALNTARNAMDYAIPGADHDHEIREPGFTLLGWLFENERDARMDEMDPARRSVRGVPFGPSDALMQRLGLSRDLIGRVWRSANGEALFAYDQWDHDMADEFGSAGSRLLVPRDDLGGILQSTGQSLLVEVSLGRHLAGEYHPKRRSKAWRLFVVDPDLQVRTPDPGIMRLGRYWVRRLGFEPGVDTYARWLIHRIVELDVKRTTAVVDRRRELELEMSALAGRLGARPRQRR